MPDLRVESESADGKDVTVQKCFEQLHSRRLKKLP